MDDSNLPSWAVAVIAALASLFGGGGVAAVVKAVSDRRSGVQSHDLAEDDAIVARWQALSDAQIKSLLEPLQRRLGSVEAELAEVKSQLSDTRRRYWLAISYVRTLYTWITRNDAIAETEIPEPPADLAGDI